MQNAASTPTGPASAAAPFFSSLFHAATLASTTTRSRPGTSAGEQASHPPPTSPAPAVPAVPARPSAAADHHARPHLLSKDRRPSLSKKASFTRRRASSISGASSAVGFFFPGSSAAAGSSAAHPPNPFAAPPPLPSASAAAKMSSSLGGPGNAAAGLGIHPAPSAAVSPASASSQHAPPVPFVQPSESSIVVLHIQEVANKRISTLEYLRKAHEGRVYWFNTLRFDRPDLSRMSYFDHRRLARRATNYLLLGLSLPTVVDLNSGSALELLRSLNALLAEFDAYQQLHPETGSASAATSLSRAARLPQMFRRAGPGMKGRRTSSSAASGQGDAGSGGMGGGGGFAIGSPDANGADAFGGALTPAHAESAGINGAMSGSTSAASTAFVTYYDNNVDLLPGEEYALLLTPSLPFDPDFFETFATLCDVLIDFYTRLLSLLPTPRESSGSVAEQFAKVDARIRKLLVQGVVKEFEEHSRAGVKTEVANIGKVVLGGLM